MINSKEILKNDINDMFNKLNDLCKCSSESITLDMQEIDLKLKDFRPYRNTVNSIVKTFDSLNKLYDYSLYKDDKNYIMIFITNIEYEIKRINALKEICKDNNEQYRCLQDTHITLTNTLDKIYKSQPTDVNEWKKICEKQQNKTPEIEDFCGLKDKNKIQAIKEALRHENRNLKAIVIIVEPENKNGKIIISPIYSIPFTSIEKAQEYIDSELELLGMQAFLIKINEEETVFVGGSVIERMSQK